MRAMLLAIDWTRAAVRAWSLGPLGRVEASEAQALDLGQASRTDLIRVLGTLRVKLAGPGARTLVCGAIGGAGGLLEAPLLPCPIDLGTLGQHLTSRGGAFVVPGLSGAGPAGLPDALRGEETRLLGALPTTGRSVVCLPGYRTRWAVADGRRLERFGSAMTEELRSLLLAVGPLAELAEGTEHDGDAFAEGALAARTPGGLVHHLAAARTRVTLSDEPAAGTASFLAGLLIGHEVAGMTAAFGEGPVLVVGDAPPADRYAAVLGDRATVVDGASAARTGLWRIAEQAGWTQA
jgi:2-dehydro-3-deoxygalactonokinase